MSLFACRRREMTDDFDLEVDGNITELTRDGLVQRLEIIERNKQRALYRLTLLEGGDELKVEFKRGIGYFVQQQHFETMQALLSSLSPNYRSAFASKISERLLEMSH